MRLFTGIEIPDSVKEQLMLWWSASCPALEAEQWRAVSPHLWHLTLAFYGEVSGHEADDIAEELAQCTSEAAPISLKTGGYGLFAKPSKARVFWVGVEEDPDCNSLKHLARCCRRAGHATVRKRTAREAAFQAHITVARSTAQHGFLDLQRLQMMADVPEINWRADRINLYQSILKPEGPQYRRLETFELNSSRFRTRGKYV
ncbi:RNA 2',3'-cyclic phosphodiesterase [Mariprofundus sp. NF]|uniref:RNA 2',3'-cyclic phosphodiesterase n=1 Tax=Mariprofundus sp. NF TaxID=2608716 RepID=UPI0015A13344|nr:RNA 2',3'-cyclic phosphodiesterase [Mariprofundus sp. NF]NWF39839.1 RNA 2',3'-cyclic phosphodiesterase [Mariprofundus sp. NF]